MPRNERGAAYAKPYCALFRRHHGGKMKDWTWSIADVRGDHIPAGPGFNRGTSDGHFRSQAPRSLDCPDSSPTVRFDAVRKTVVICVYQRSLAVNEEKFRWAVRKVAEDHGIENVLAIEFYVSAQTMRNEAWWLIAKGYERQPEGTSYQDDLLYFGPDNGLWCWRRTLKKRPGAQKKEEAA